MTSQQAHAQGIQPDARPPYAVGTCDFCGNAVMSNAIGQVLTGYDPDDGETPCGFICPACDHNNFEPLCADRADHDPFGD